MKTGTKKKMKINTIVVATAVTIFTLFSSITGVYAWFNANQSASVTGMTFSVVVPDSLEYELYYLRTFTDDESNTRDGNYNSTTGVFSGYQEDFETATFRKINFEDGVVTDSPDPTNIMHLWPAHKLTFAFVITASNMNKLSLTDWSETVGSAVTEDDNDVCLSWAINIYGKAFSVLDTSAVSGNNLHDLAVGYESYFAASKTDVFEYSEEDPAPPVKETLDIVSSVPVNADGYRTIVYFTIEFSNDETTFYRLDESTGKYVYDTVNGNSNCYEGLSITNLEFTIA